MINSFLEPDEKQPEKIEIEGEEKQPEEIETEREEKPADELEFEKSFESFFAGIELPPSTLENLSEISEPADDELIVSEKPPETPPAESSAERTEETFNFSEPHYNQPENYFTETEAQDLPADNVNEPTEDEPLAGFPIDETNFELPTQARFEEPNVEFDVEGANETANFETPFEIADEPVNYASPAEPQPEKSEFENSGTLFQTPAEPESFAETARNTGLAYAAAITLFGAVVFMLIIGWFADLLLGSSPWGIVIGILLGAGIGFLQFFRLTAQIFKDRN